MGTLDIELNTLEARVLGCLVEKEKSTPDYYPLTLNALTAACNQKSNRRPVMAMDNADVIRALDGLRDKKLAWEATSASTRVPKYQHRFTERFSTSEARTALLCELLLRGPQTVGELRTHASRLAPLGSLEDVSSQLVALASLDEGPMVLLLPREPGKREPRYTHLLCGQPDVQELAAAPPEPARVTVRETDARLDHIEDKIGKLEASFQELQGRFDGFIRQFE